MAIIIYAILRIKTMIDYYKTLEVNRDVDLAGLEKAYKRLIKKYHPDVNKSIGAEEKTKQINAAYNHLKNIVPKVSSQKQTYKQKASTSEDEMDALMKRVIKKFMQDDITRSYNKQKPTIKKAPAPEKPSVTARDELEKKAKIAKEIREKKAREYREIEKRTKARREEKIREESEMHEIIARAKELEEKAKKELKK